MRTIAADGKEVLLEPRVMQVLVAFARNPGQVLSRDNLIALCWDGRIVGDDAINRAISLLRQGLAEVVGEAVRLETIKKVGFRLVTDEPALSPGGSVETLGLSRRIAILGGAGGVLALGSVAAWFNREAILGSPRDPRVVALAERAHLIQLTGEPGTSEQAVAFYKQAVSIDPDDADSWGALALAHLLTFSGFSNRDRTSVREQMISAARRSLALDPDQPDADAALSFSEPAFGNYARFDAATTGLLDRHPDYWYAHARRAMFLRDVGRLRDSRQFAQRSIEIDPMLPIGWGNVAIGHAMSGDLLQADATFEEATRRWPAHGYLWNQRFALLLELGRYDEAIALARDPRARPDYIPAEVGEQRAALALAIQKGDQAALANARMRITAEITRDLISAQRHAPTLVAMGFADDAFDSLSRLFAVAAQSKTIALQVATVFLFRPAFAPLRNDSRYQALLKASGLEKYWRLSGSQPDFRRS
ncbi:winged helix-turn-helix domain-containing protein [Tsuneonella dongtanensis]|nr:winged helix-turn-helix domain-containing protein [Tsuneonella dongtanensis]